MKKTLRIALRIFEGAVVALLLFIGSLFFREQQLPVEWAIDLASGALPTNYVLHVESLSFGFRHGLNVSKFRLYDRMDPNMIDPIASADSISYFPLRRMVIADALAYKRLPPSYYQPGNQERNERLEVELPEIPSLTVILHRPNILGVAPEQLTTEVTSRTDRLDANHIRIEWPDKDEPMFLNGFCYVDIGKQEVYGEVDGSAMQRHIRPLLVTLDVPVSLPYMDGFTEVEGKVPSWCGWKVNLTNNDFDLYLRLKPKMGKYNLVQMDKADGNIHLRVETRGTSLNYHHEIGPIAATGVNGERMEGTVKIDGVNGTNTVEVTANSDFPVADLLKIGGFIDEYVGEEVRGESVCKLKFKFPRAMTNNYEVLQGEGHVEVKKGQLMRMKGFRGLIELLADKVPGVSWFTDSTQGSCDYTIENGVLKTDNIYIEGTVFSIKMYGAFDIPKDALDFKVRVQFMKKDSFAGKILHPLTWPFTKLLLEFKLTGSTTAPKWNYISVIDRVMEVTK